MKYSNLYGKLFICVSIILGAISILFNSLGIILGIFGLFFCIIPEKKYNQLFYFAVFINLIGIGIGITSLFFVNESDSNNFILERDLLNIKKIRDSCDLFNIQTNPINRSSNQIELIRGNSYSEISQIQINLNKKNILNYTGSFSEFSKVSIPINNFNSGDYIEIYVLSGKDNCLVYSQEII